MGHHYPRAGAEARHFAGHNTAGHKAAGHETASRETTRVSSAVEIVDIEELREENEKLRSLVVELSRIVARHVTERK